MNYNDLSDNINKLSVEELDSLLIEFNNSFITEQKYECIKLIVYEIEYRRLSKFIKEPTDLKIILDYNYEILWKIDSGEIENSMEFMDKNNIQVSGILRWIPIFLSMNRVYYIYKKLKTIGYENDKILDALILDIRIYLDDNINKNIKYDDDKDFVMFILEIVRLINDRRKDTDVYKRMMDELIEENSYALNHLK